MHPAATRLLSGSLCIICTTVNHQPWHYQQNLAASAVQGQPDPDRMQASLTQQEASAMWQRADQVQNAGRTQVATRELRAQLRSEEEAAERSVQV